MGYHNHGFCIQTDVEAKARITVMQLTSNLKTEEMSVETELLDLVPPQIS